MEAANDIADSRTLGQLFAAERERQGLARAEVAQRLHMSAWQIEALEAGDYARLPQGTFLRGFVRNYAKVLNLDPDTTLSHLAQSAPQGSAPGIVVPSQNIRFHPLGKSPSSPYLKFGGLFMVLTGLGLAVLYWWLFIREAPMGGLTKKTAEPMPQNIAAAPVQPVEPVVPRSAPTEAIPAKAEAPKAEPKAPKVAAKAEPPKAAPARTEAPKTVPAKAETAPRPEQAPATALTPVSATGTARRLRLRFKGESWVEVRDRNGKILLSRLNAPGSEAEVSGRPPLNVIIGNAPEVQVQYEDRDFPLEPHTKVAVARFTVE